MSKIVYIWKYYITIRKPPIIEKIRQKFNKKISLLATLFVRNSMLIQKLSLFLFLFLH